MRAGCECICGGGLLPPPAEHLQQRVRHDAAVARIRRELPFLAPRDATDAAARPQPRRVHVEYAARMARVDLEGRQWRVQ